MPRVRDLHVPRCWQRSWFRREYRATAYFVRTRFLFVYLSSFSTQFYRPFLSFVLSQGPMKSRDSIGSSVHPTSSLDRRAPIIRKWRGRGKEILLAVISLSRGKWRLLLHLFLSHYSLPVSERELINAQMQQGALFCNNSVYMYIYIYRYFLTN